MTATGRDSRGASRRAADDPKTKRTSVANGRKASRFTAVLRPPPPLSLLSRFKLTSLHLTRRAVPPATLSTWGAFKAEARNLKKRQRLDAAIERSTQQGSNHRAAIIDQKPTRPLSSSKTILWAWYRATGKSWRQFVFDYGEP